MRRAVQRSDHGRHPRTHASGQDIAEIAAGRLRLGDGCVLGRDRALMQPLDYGAEQRFLGFEMMIERLPRQAGRFGNLLDRGAAKAVPAEHQHGGIENAVLRSHLTILTNMEDLSNRDLVKRPAVSTETCVKCITDGRALAA